MFNLKLAKYVLNQYIEILYPFILIFYAKSNYDDSLLANFFYIQSIASISIIFSEVAINPLLVANGIVKKSYIISTILTKSLVSLTILIGSYIFLDLSLSLYVIILSFI